MLPLNTETPQAPEQALANPDSQPVTAGGDAVSRDARDINSVGPDTREPDARERDARERAGGLGLWLRDVLISVFASVLIIMFLYQPVRVEGTSMLPRLEDHDRLFINKFVYHFTSIHRGDVVVFHYPRDPVKSYIKRVIAVPGDRLRIDRGQVILNGQALPEPYVPDQFRDEKSAPEMVVPADEYFMMGDHRSISSDSREFGPVDRDLVYGKAVFVYWPTRDAGVVQ